jgi:hypothetical protein
MLAVAGYAVNNRVGTSHYDTMDGSLVPLSGSLFVHCSGSTYVGIPARLPLYVVLKCGTSHVQDRVSAWRIPNHSASLPYLDTSNPRSQLSSAC